MGPHPIRLVVEDDLARSRVTVFFRVILAIPHLIWISIWGIGVVVVALISWFVVLFKGRLPESLHDFFAKYVRYSTHLYGYLYLAANDYPGFFGEEGRYAIDVKVDGPFRQSRWKTGFRLLLALPAALIAGTLGGFGSLGGGWGGSYSSPGAEPEVDPWVELASTASSFVSAIAVVALLGWFVCVALGRMPLGFRDLVAYGLRYSAQTLGYFLFLTDRYPDADPRVPAATQPTPEQPVTLAVEGDLRRSRLTVFFRFLLALPHLVWFVLWSVLVAVAAVIGWFAALATGRLPGFLHRFLGAYVRYSTHLFAFIYVVANPFPGFAGAPGSYPVDLEIAPREHQSRLKTLFRLVLVVPASLLSLFLGSTLTVVAVLSWFTGVFLGRVPEGIRNLGAYCLRYSAQTSAYGLLLTDSYPYSGPVEYVEPEPEEAVAAWPALPLSPSFSS